MKTGLSTTLSLALFFAFLTMSITGAFAAKPTFKTPDFAYPQTVETDAAALLKRADAMSGTEAAVTRLRAVLEISKARAEIDPEAMYAQPAFVAGQAARLRDNDGAKALFVVLEAQKYVDIYSAQPWKYNNVDAPLRPFPKDVSEWSGDQFRYVTDSLMTEAVRIATSASPVALAEFTPCVVADDITLSYFPTVADFVYYKAYTLRERISTDNNGNIATAEAAMKAAGEGTPGYFYWAVTVNNIRTRMFDSRNVQSLRELYSRWKDNVAARYLLVNIVGASVYNTVEMPVEENGEVSEEAAKEAAIKARDEMISEVETSLKRFPDWYGNNRLRNYLLEARQPKADYTFPKMVAPGVDFDVKVTYSFAKNISVGLYPPDFVIASS